MNVRLPIADLDPNAPLLPPYPRGWYTIADSDDLAPGEVKPIRAFGREFVVFRGEGGEAHVLNAHCPHLGAHLGHGGKVCGDRVRCPFHGWEFEGQTGACAKIPNGDPIPPKAKVPRWHVIERYGMIMIWVHDEGGEPQWPLAEFEDFDLAWSPWSKTTWEFTARIQDVGENDSDITHTPVLHTLTDHIPELEMNTDGPVCDWSMEMKVNPSAFGLPKLPRLYKLLTIPELLQTKIQIRRSGFSLGLIRQKTELARGLTMRSQSLCSTTPIDEHHVRFVVRHRIGRVPTKVMTRFVLRRYAKIFDEIFDEDVQIWKHKVYRMRPTASKGDWAVMKFRKWAKQFYAEGVYEDALRREEDLRSIGALP